MKFRSRIQFGSSGKYWAITAILVMLLGTLFIVHSNAEAEDDAKGHLITVYDRGSKSAFLTEASTLGGALKEANIELDPRDTVEPSRDEELVASEYKVNIYRARPVVVVDGVTRTKVMTPYQTAARIAGDADIPLFAEDIAKVTRSDDYVGDGAGLQLTVDRATAFTLDLYGRKNETRTQGETVADMLKEKNIEFGENDRVSVGLETAITPGIEVRVWREGKQTVTLDEQVPYSVEQIFDADREIGYRQIQSPGVLGTRAVTYEIEIVEGVERSRKVISKLDTKLPTKEIVIVGIKTNPKSLTKAKGAQQYTDSKGVTHRETYYDLDMSRVMQSCGQGGRYSVRADGAKIDAGGYVIVAANYGNYPKCSVVETSMGPGKVYDTGGFAARHPHGFDLATDWSRADGI